MCLTPLSVKEKLSGKTVAVPCGRCPVCVKRRASAWSFRLMQQEKISTSAVFLTLTYGDKKIQRSKNGFLSLCKKDLQVFFKQLRKLHEPAFSKPPRKYVCPIAPGKRRFFFPGRIKYYAVGEYGSTTMRPHYHVILFNASQKLIQDAWSKFNHELGVYEHLGGVHYGTVTGASVGYTLKYVSKEKRVPAHSNDDRQPEFCLVSKGIGLNFLRQLQ